jgi:hypothetical protein
MESNLGVQVKVVNVLVVARVVPANVAVLLVIHADAHPVIICLKIELLLDIYSRY